MRCARSRPYIEINLFTPSLRPVRTMPPLRELAPQPMVSASKTATLAPSLASVLAAESPVKPAPMMATLTLSGIGRAGSVPGICAVVNQKFCSWTGMCFRTGGVCGARGSFKSLTAKIAKKSRKGRKELLTALQSPRSSGLRRSATGPARTRLPGRSCRSGSGRTESFPSLGRA